MSPRPRPNTPQTPLGELLERVRGDLPIHAAAARVGVTQATWTRWETGQRDPSHESLRRIAAEFGISATRLGKAILTECSRGTRETGETTK